MASRIRVQHKEYGWLGDVASDALVIQGWVKVSWDNGTQSTEALEDIQTRDGSALIATPL